ncbi:MAG: hypothetical protein K9J42_01955 [Sulfuritalea sp.]|nr:hypothetical protein [Sulfuritalea sp.]
MVTTPTIAAVNIVYIKLCVTPCEIPIVNRTTGVAAPAAMPSETVENVLSLPHFAVDHSGYQVSQACFLQNGSHGPLYEQIHWDQPLWAVVQWSIDEKVGVGDTALLGRDETNVMLTLLA